MSRKRKEVGGPTMEKIASLLNDWNTHGELSFQNRLWLHQALSSQAQQAQRKAFRNLPEDLLYQILKGHTTTGLPKNLSLIDKKTRNRVDSIFTDAVKAADCDFLTDSAKGCHLLRRDSPIFPTCRKYCRR